MASPQLENGHTRIANEVIESICQARLSGNEISVLLYALRQTYGWGGRRKTEPFMPSSVGEKINMSKSSVHLAIQVLIERGIVSRDDKGRLSFLKDHEKWSGPVQPTERKRLKPVQPTEPTVQPTEPTVQPTEPTVQPTEPYKEKERKKERKKEIATIPPKIEDVKEYCLGRNKGVDPEAWFDHYSARGWKYKGGQRMVDWEAAVRTWERNNFNNAYAKPTPKKDPNAPVDIHEFLAAQDHM